MGENKLDNRRLRSFGLIVGLGFAVVAFAPVFLSRHSPRMWALAVSVALSGTALVAPSALRSFHRVWMTIGEGLGWVNSRIILSILYYFLIVPIGAIQRMSGKDAMRRRFDAGADTYKVPRARRPSSHMQHQY